MKVVNVYEQYFAAELTFQEVPRRAALVMLTATSDAGTIKYEAGVTFFPHRDETDYAVSYDAWFSRELYSGQGRRSKKREGKLLETLRREIDELAGGVGGTVFWDRPLQPERRG